MASFQMAHKPGTSEKICMIIILFVKIRIPNNFCFIGLFSI